VSSRLFIAKPSRSDRCLSTRSHTPRLRTVYSTTIPRLRVHHCLGTASQGGVDRWALTVPRAPLPEGRCDRLSARDCNPCRRALPQLSRSYGLMRRTSILSRPRLYPCTLSLCRLLRAPAGRRPFPALSPRICLQVPGPLPRRSPWCIYSFLPMGHRPSPFPKQVGMPQKSRATTSARRLFSGLPSFTHVQAPGFARHPGRSHRRSGSLDPIRGSRDFYVHAYLGSLPHRAVDMLAVRIEQLTAEGLSPSKIRGLAGRS
jgi:hypothetical protein